MLRSAPSLVLLAASTFAAPVMAQTYPLGEGSTVTASYTKRIQRPSPAELDPFRYAADTSNQIEGNASLRPEDISAYEVAIESRKGPAFTTLTAYRRETRDAFTIEVSDLGNGVLLQSRINAGQRSNTGLEISVGNKISSKLTYNFSIDAYEAEIEGGGGAPIAIKSTFANFGKFNLTWQISRKDNLQLNVFANSKTLLPQGYVAPTYSGNIGFRHDISKTMSWIFVIQDPFATLNNRFVVNTATGRFSQTLRVNSRVLSVTLLWNFAGKPKDAGFDFIPGGSASN